MEVIEKPISALGKEKLPKSEICPKLELPTSEGSEFLLTGHFREETVKYFIELL